MAASLSCTLLVSTQKRAIQHPSATLIRVRSRLIVHLWTPEPSGQARLPAPHLARVEPRRLYHVAPLPGRRLTCFVIAPAPDQPGMCHRPGRRMTPLDRLSRHSCLAGIVAHNHPRDASIGSSRTVARNCARKCDEMPERRLPGPPRRQRATPRVGLHQRQDPGEIPGDRRRRNMETLRDPLLRPRAPA